MSGASERPGTSEWVPDRTRHVVNVRTGYEMKPVSELLKRRPSAAWITNPEMTVFDALHLLARHDVGALMVIEQRQLCGIVSERDYTRKIALWGRKSDEVTVAEIMTRNIVVVSPQTRSRECMALMSQHKVRHLPVLAGETVLGMISMRDIVDDIISDHEATIEQLRQYIHG